MCRAGPTCFGPCVMRSLCSCRAGLARPFGHVQLHHRIMSIIVPWLPRPLQWSPYPPGSISVLEHELSIFPRCAHVVDKATQLGAQQDHPKLGRILGNVERIHGLLWMGWIKNSNQVDFFVLFNGISGQLRWMNFTRVLSIQSESHVPWSRQH